MDRDLPTAGPRAERAAPSLDPALVIGGLAMVGLAPASVVLLRLFPALVPQAHGVEWLLPASGIAASLCLAVGMLQCAQHGVRRRSWPALLRAAALGMLGAGVAVASLRATSSVSPSHFPDDGVAGPAVLAGAALLLAELGSSRWRWSSLRTPVPWLLLFGLVEAALAAAVLLPPAGDAWPWLMGLAAALAAASAVPSPWLPAGLLAGAFVALGAARLGSLDTLPGVIAALGAGLAYGVQRSSAAAASATTREGDLPTDARPAAPIMAGPTGEDEATRLARELRGTIAELLRARRTIELQREEIVRGAAEDALTGVATRRAILERLRFETAEANRYQHPIAVLLLDVDDFGALNRDRGMRIGDEVLREIALRLRLRMRAADALGRVGGDSFMAVLPHTDEAGAAIFADALRRRLIGRPVETSEGEVTLRVSIGLAFVRAGASPAEEELLAAADEALASARAAGGNRIAFDRMHGLVRLEERRADRGSA